jgi:hypothetical protein
MVWSSQTHSEEPLTTLSEIQTFPYDWSPDGASLLVSQVATDTKDEVWLLPVAAAPHAETAARKSFRIQNTIFTNHTSRPTGDGLYLGPPQTRRRSRNQRCTWYPLPVAPGLGLPTASIGTIGLAGHRIEKRYILFRDAVVFQCVGHSFRPGRRKASWRAVPSFSVRRTRQLSSRSTRTSWC